MGREDCAVYATLFLFVLLFPPLFFFQKFKLKNRQFQARFVTETFYSFYSCIIFKIQNHQLGARDFSSAVSGFCQVFIVIRAKSLRPKMCRPSANTANSRRTREKPLVPRVTSGRSLPEKEFVEKVQNVASGVENNALLMNAF